MSRLSPKAGASQLKQTGSSRARPPPLAIQVDPIELVLHGGAVHATTHLDREDADFAQQTPAPERRKPEAEFAMLNILAKLVQALKQVDPSKPEGVVLRAMVNNFVTAEALQAYKRGDKVAAKKLDEFATPQFQQAMNELQNKYGKDPPKRDALRCVAAAAHQQPLTEADVVDVFRNLAEGMNLSPEQTQQLLQLLVQAVRLKQKEAEEWNKRAAQQGNPSMLDLANVVADGTTVNSDGTFATRGGQPTVFRPDETTGMLEMCRDFWMALFKAGQDPNLQDDLQREFAEVMRNVGQRYVRTGRNASDMQTADQVDAKAHRFLIQKLRADPRVKADTAKMAALDKLAEAEASRRPLTPDELAQIFDALGRGVQLTPETLLAILQYMFTNMRSIQKKPQDIQEVKSMVASGGAINPADAIRMVNQANVQKPAETVACLELFKNFFVAMNATKQNALLRDHYQRMMAETLRNAGQLHVRTDQSRLLSGAGTSAYVQPPADPNAYQMMLMKLRSDPTVKSDPVKARAIEELAAAQTTGKQLSPQQLLDIFRELSRGVQVSPEMLKIILENMCNQMRALSPNEKAELQKRFRQTPRDPTDFVVEASQVRSELIAMTQQSNVVGCFQVLPEGHPALRNRPPPTTQSREVGMRAGPASIDWHRYQALGNQSPATEMARIIVVQSHLADAEKFDDEKTQRTLMHEAAEVSFRSILEPSVMKKYEQSLRTNREALSALQSLSRIGTMDDKQLGKRVDQLLTTLDIDRPQLRAVLQQLVQDRLMTNDEAKAVERRCEVSMAGGGGKMKLSELQGILAKKGGR